MFGRRSSACPDEPGPVFATAVNPTSTLPVPLAPDVTDSSSTLLVAVQPQPGPAVRFTDPVAPPAAASNVAVASVMAQPVPCVTVNVCPPTVIAAARRTRVRATVNRTAPSPVPVAPDEIVSHPIVDVAVQPQPVPVRTVNDP